MADPFLAEIKMFGGNFAPRGYALCNGQLLPISQNTAIFSLLGTTYGGDGRSTFALPNLQSSTPMFWGSGGGLTQRFIGEASGQASVTLLLSEMAAHTHSLNCNDSEDGGTNPQTKTFTGGERGGDNAYAVGPANVMMNVQTCGITGSSLPHNNRQPYLGVTFIIALQGIFPQRN